MHKKRLETIVSLINPSNSTLDVGTDHGYLPILLKSYYPTMKIGASDINIDPLENARNNFKNNNLGDIKTYLSNGLESIVDEYKTVVITGMGTHTIIDILEKGNEYLINVDELILSSHQNIPELRKWLWDNGFEIVNEKVVLDSKFYEIFKVKKATNKTIYDDNDLIFGKFRNEKRHDDFKLKWEYELAKKKDILKNVVKKSDFDLLNSEINRIEQVIK